MDYRWGIIPSHGWFMSMCNGSDTINPDLAVPNISRSQFVAFTRCEIDMKRLGVFFTGDDYCSSYMLSSTTFSNDTYGIVNLKFLK